MALNDLPAIEQEPGEKTRESKRREYYTGLNNWCQAALDEGQALQEDVPELREISLAFDYLVGMQWKEAMPSYRSKPVSNEFMQMFWETIGLLTDIRPIFHITDVSKDKGYSEIGDILNRGAKAWAATSHFEKRNAFCTMYGMLTSAPAKLYWNPFARGNSGDPSDGDISLEALSPNAVMTLGDNGEDIQDAELVIYRHVKTIDWIKRAYPLMGKYVKPEEQLSRFTIDVQSPTGISPQLYPPLSPGMKRLLGAQDRASYESVFPKAEIQEFWRNDDSINDANQPMWMGPKGAPWGYWVKPGQKLYPRGRTIIRSNDVILYDQPNCYYHRKKPFAVLGLYAVPWQKYAMSVVSPWMRQQDILNQIMAGLLQTVKKAVNPALMAAKSAINPAALKAIDSSKPGLKITYSQNAPHPPSWQTPPVIPPYVLQTYGQILNSMKQASGAAAMNQAMSKNQIPGGDTLEKISFAKNTPVRVMGRSQEWFLDDIGFMWTSNFLQFYDGTKRLELLGPAGLAKEDMDNNPNSLIPEGIDSESFVRRYHFKTEKGSLLNVQRQEKVPAAFALRKGRDLSRRKLFETLDWNINLGENDKELAAEAAAQAQAMAAAGGPHKGKK